jgi:hypothetical protein
MDIKLLISYAFSSKALIMPTITFLSPKLDKRKQRRLERAMRMKEYFSISLSTRRTHPQVLFNISGETYFSPYLAKRV